MEGRKIGCCVSGVWAKTIGWFQIVGTITGIIILMICLFVGPTLNRKDDEVAFEMHQRNNTIKSLVLLLAILSFIMGIILTRAVYQERASPINAWIVFTLISLILLAIVTIVGVVIGVNIVLSVCMVSAMIVQGASAWIINIHQKEAKILLPVKV